MVGVLAVVLLSTFPLAAKHKEHVLLESIELTSRCSGVSAAKVAAGVALALRQSGQFTLVTPADSPYVSLQAAGLPADSIKARLSIGRRLRVRVDCFHGLLRAELTLHGAGQRSQGIGYALIRHRWENTDEPLADVALLQALERALCLAVSDSLLYARSDSTMRIVPAAVLAVTSMVVRDNPSLVPPWELFADAVATSYSGILAAITGAQRSPYYVTLDIDTRDSMYAYFRLYEPEPGMPPSSDEIAALAYFGIEALVSGTIERTSDGARIELVLWRITPEHNLQLVARRSRKLDDDSRVRYLETVAALAEELLLSPLPALP
ncbi:MAG: hypothetical protein RMK00_07460 [Bacteroidota bacterium]|nr:hypothetical protein [Candidatus Kapabacteria bacterium]MDW8075593.1 hypothetical protein [Bacteroidota bacterium]